jgi:hypothetical protein
MRFRCVLNPGRTDVLSTLRDHERMAVGNEHLTDVPSVSIIEVNGPNVIEPLVCAVRFTLNVVCNKRSRAENTDLVFLHCLSSRISVRLSNNQRISIVHY